MGLREKKEKIIELLKDELSVSSLEDMSSDYIGPIGTYIEREPAFEINLKMEDLSKFDITVVEAERIFKKLHKDLLISWYSKNETKNADEDIDGFFVCVPKSTYIKFHDVRDIRGQNRKKFPANLTWEDIIVKFTNGDNIEITLKSDKNFYMPTDSRDMKLQHSRSLRRKKAWIFFNILAVRGGQLTWKDDLPEISYRERNNFQKRKEELSKVLRDFFGLYTDPFDPYYSDEGYKIKITLIPAETPNSKKSQDKYHDLKEVMEEEQSQVYEEQN